MRNYIATILLTVSFTAIYSASAQDEISWNHYFDSEKSEIVITAKLKEHWHIYSQFNDKNSGPVPTVFSFVFDNGVELIGGVSEPKPIVVFDKNFDSELKLFEDEVTFRQRIKVSSAVNMGIEILYMLCDDKGCLPPKIEFLELNIPQTVN